MTRTRPRHHPWSLHDPNTPNLWVQLTRKIQISAFVCVLILTVFPSLALLSPFFCLHLPPPFLQSARFFFSPHLFLSLLCGTGSTGWVRFVTSTRNQPCVSKQSNRGTDLIIFSFIFILWKCHCVYVSVTMSGIRVWKVDRRTEV